MRLASILFALSSSGFLSVINAFVDSGLGGTSAEHLTEISAGQYQGEYKRALRRLFLFDNNGVLLPSEPSDEDHETARLFLGTLTSDPKNEVWVITARSRQALVKLYENVPGLNLAGQFGLQTTEDPKSGPTGKLAKITEDFYEKNLKSLATQHDVGPLIQLRIGSIIFQHGGVRKGKRDAFLQQMLNLHDESNYAFKDHDIFAALTHSQCNKGTLAKKLLEKYEGEEVFGISVGDSNTDEPMHQAMNEHLLGTKLSIFVNGDAKTSTAAKSRLQDPAAVRKFFTELVS